MDRNVGTLENGSGDSVSVACKPLDVHGVAAEPGDEATVGLGAYRRRYRERCTGDDSRRRHHGLLRRVWITLPVAVDGVRTAIRQYAVDERLFWAGELRFSAGRRCSLGCEHIRPQYPSAIQAWFNSLTQIAQISQITLKG